MLTMPLAMAICEVAAKSVSKCGESPGSKRPEDHNAP